MKPLVVLGATGSIGTQTLEVADVLDIPVAVLAARRPSDALVASARDHPAAEVIAADATPADVARLADALGDRVSGGHDALLAAAATPGRTVVNGIVGAAGLATTVCALEAGNRVALANKESLISGGPVVLDALERGGGELIPVDSEHSALFQCLIGEDPTGIGRLVLTASGGPFRGRSRAELETVSVAEALAHPTWRMGPRITIDSATLVNKAFEVIEAHLLFDIGYDAIDVVVHPQSIVHSLVEFVDGSVKAQLGDPDMRKPIQYAITHPDRVPIAERTFDLTNHTLTFEQPDRSVFRALDLGRSAGEAGGSAPAVFNAADEIAVAAFLDGRLSFLGITDAIDATLQRLDVRPLGSVADVHAVDAEARAVCTEIIETGAAG